jgi:lipopolysaccharide transport system ATP-binding protein
MTAGIEVADVSVDFPLYHGSARSLKKTVLSTLTGRMGADTKNRVVVQALRDVSFRLGSGDRLGLIGRCCACLPASTSRRLGACACKAA